MKTIIKVENLSKQYRLGVVGSGTLRDDLYKWWSGIRGKENPLLKLGETNDRSIASESKYVWSLKDINFEVNQGDVLGVIGKNGAGKSTLLKILSRITAPSTGSIKINGRVASLLEVGTGFHPELTGRENIFLNGAILGMKKSEITSKLDEIVQFAGIERYLDTPVKRYSSGMYVRLAFAVAAHLEPEILIVDEVLAVGDLEFQKKAIGKMQEVSKGGGRTVIFVSHSMDTIERLCNKTLLLENGRVSNFGPTKDIISQYLKVNNHLESYVKYDINSENQHPVTDILEAYVHDEDNKISDSFDITKKIGITFRYKVYQETQFIGGLDIYDERDNLVFVSHDVKTIYQFENHRSGVYKYTVWIPENLLAEGNFSIWLALFKPVPIEIHHHKQNMLKFKVIDFLRGNSSRGKYNGGFPGSIRPMLNWESIKETDTI